VTKGEQTREAVLREALGQSSHIGLRGISIGGLADSMSMSKSGLFAHFRSKEQLQIDILDFAGQWFGRRVLLPALQVERGEPRLRKLVERWLGWGGFADYALPGGCIFVTAAREFDDEPDGPVRDRVVAQQQEWLDSLSRVVQGGVTEGHFRPDTDPVAVAHDVYAVMLGCHLDTRLLRDPAANERACASIDRLIAGIST
jgi:AcrR family transcriptional regulator